MIQGNAHSRRRPPIRLLVTLEFGAQRKTLCVRLTRERCDRTRRVSLTSGTRGYTARDPVQPIENSVAKVVRPQPVCFDSLMGGSHGE